MQLYLAIGIPVLLNFAAILWQQSRAVDKTLGSRIDGLANRIESLEKVINSRFNAVDTKFEVVDAKFEAAKQALLRVEGILDARLHSLEQRSR